MKVYVDDMLVKSKKKEDHISDLSTTFEVLQKYKMKFNAAKCSFGVSLGKFLGFLINYRGIKVNLEKLKLSETSELPPLSKKCIN